MPTSEGCGSICHCPLPLPLRTSGERTAESGEALIAPSWRPQPSEDADPQRPIDRGRATHPGKMLRWPISRKRPFSLRDRALYLGGWPSTGRDRVFYLGGRVWGEHACPNKVLCPRWVTVPDGLRSALSPMGYAVFLLSRMLAGVPESRGEFERR